LPCRAAARAALEGTKVPRSGPTLLRREVDVAAAHGQSIGLTDGRAGPNLDAQVQVARHLPDDRELLRVFLPEVGPIRLEYPEELHDHRRHAAEVPRPPGPLQSGGDGA